MKMERPQLDIKKVLGFVGEIENYALLSGMESCVPGIAWFLNYPKSVQILWKTVFQLWELSLIGLLVSNSVGMFTEKEAGKVECFAILILLIGGFFRFKWLDRQRNVFQKSITNIHSVGEQLLSNRMIKSSYLNLHQLEMGKIYNYYKMRSLILFMIVNSILVTALIPGLIWPRKDSRLPMSGWLPIDRSIRWQFTLACFALLEFHWLFLYRDIYCNAAVHFPLSAINAQLIYLQKLLDQIVNEGKDIAIIKWWIVQHQSVLRNLSEFMEIAGPQLTVFTVGPAFNLFLYLFSVTEEEEYILIKHVSILTFCVLMITHVYIVSTIGDELGSNSTKVCIAVENKRFWDMPRANQILLYQVAIRCMTPVEIRFSKIALLNVSYFGSVLTKMLGYFNTMYQLRNG